MCVDTGDLPFGFFTGFEPAVLVTCNMQIIGINIM